MQKYGRHKSISVSEQRNILTSWRHCCKFGYTIFVFIEMYWWTYLLIMQKMGVWHANIIRVTSDPEWILHTVWKADRPEWEKGQWKDTARNDIKLLTVYQANKTRVGIRTVRWDPARPGIKPLTNCQATRVEVRTVRRLAQPGMKSLTSCQAHRTKVEMRTVRMASTRPGMKSFTSCQANKTTVRRDPAVPGQKSLTNCQANRTRVEVRTVRSDPSWTWHEISHCLSSQQDQEWEQWEGIPLDLVWNHSLPIKLTGSKWEWEQWEGTQLGMA